MAWAIQHYDYYLRDRKFKIITDHRILKAMKEREIFGSLKLERMREKLQQYDFTIEYQNGETLVDADTLSRINEETEEYTDYEMKNKKLITDQEGKYL